MEKILNNIAMLRFKGLEGTAIFEIHDKNEVIFEYDNKDIVFEQAGSMCDVKSVNQKSHTSNNITKNKNGNIQITGNCSNVTIVNGTVFINGAKIDENTIEVDELTKVNMVIKLPFNLLKEIRIDCPLVLTIGNITNKLDVHSMGSAKLFIKELNKVNIESEGQTELTISDVKELYIDGSGQSCFKLNEVENIGLDVSGQCNIIINSKKVIKDFQLDVSGMTKIIVNSEVENCEGDISGMCNISFSKKPKHIKLDKSGMCNINY